MVYQATATVVIQDPIRSLDATTAGGISNQFIRSQLELMRSPIVTEAAMEIAARDGEEVDPDSLARSSLISGSLDSPLVTITAQADTPEAAVVFANAMAEAYREVSQRQAAATSEGQLARIDAQVAAIDERLDEIEDELGVLLADNEALGTLRDQARDAVGEIASLQAALLVADPEERAAIRGQIGDLRQAILIYNEVLNASTTGGPEQRALVQEQSLQVDRRARLLTLRDELAVDAGLAPDAIALVQPASMAFPQGTFGLRRTLAVALILGVAVGVGAAYLLSVSRRVFTLRSEPEAVLGAPLLADVPDFELEGLDSNVPIRDHPRSAAAEAYRFAAASAEVSARARGARLLFVVSSTIGHGKTTSAVNMAIASAIHGRNVLVVDSDFGNQQASRLLVGQDHARLVGITDVIAEVATLEDALHRVDLGEGVAVSLMPRGTRPSLASSALQSKAASDIFTEVAENFDLVFIDGPPLLQVAYASTLAEHAQGLIVVIEHEGRQSEVADLADRLELIGTPVIGYVYNRSPLRREMTMTEGSMMDILGDAGFNPEIPVASKRRG